MLKIYTEPWNEIKEQIELRLVIKCLDMVKTF